MPVRFQVEADFYDHPKTAGMSDAAFSLWVRAGSYCVAKLTDGFVADQVLEHALRSSKDVGQELVGRGLWRRARGGFVFHEWEGRNLTRDRVEAYRKTDAERKRAERAGQKTQVDGGDVQEMSDRTPLGVQSESDSCYVGVDVGVERPKTRAVRGDPEGFAEFYAAYPLKKARGAAVKAYSSAIKAGAAPAVLLEAAKRYADSPHRSPQFTKHPATWLNQECWLDEELIRRAPTNEWTGLR